MLDLHDVGDAALPRLAVDADDRLVGAPDVLRVDRQVGHLPDLGARRCLRVHALLDRVLVRAGERRVDEVADVRVARVHGQLGCTPRRSRRTSSMAERSRPGSTPWREQVQRERDDVDVAGALAVAEQRPLDALGARHQRELRGGHGAAAVVVRVEREDGRVALREVPAEPLDLVGVDVRRRHLDGRRQVEDHLPLGRRPPDVRHRLADLQRVVELGVDESSRASTRTDHVARRSGSALAAAARRRGPRAR